MPMKGQPARWIGTITLRNTWFSCQLRRFAEALLKHARPGQAVEKSQPGHTLPILKSSHATQATVRFAGVKVRSEEHTSELQSLMRISYAVFCLTNKTK